MGKAWTVKEENTMRVMIHGGNTMREIASALNRTTKAVSNHATIMRDRGEELPRIARGKNINVPEPKANQVVRVDSSAKIGVRPLTEQPDILDAAPLAKPLLDSKTYDTEPPYILDKKDSVALLRKHLAEAHARAVEFQADLFIAQAELDNHKKTKTWDIAIAAGLGLLTGVMAMGMWG